MKQPVRLRLPLAPVPASRPRVTRQGFTFYAEPYKSWKRLAGEAFRSLWSGPPMAAALSVAIYIYASRPKKSKLDHPRPDVDNYAKAVMDAGNGVLWADDQQVVDLTVQKRWGPPEKEGYVDLVISEDVTV